MSNNILKARLKYNLEKSKNYTNRLKSGLNKLKLVKDEKYNKDIYPLNNYNFDFKDYINNKYSPFALGITNEPTMKGLYKGVNQLNKYVDVMIKNPLPNKYDRAGYTDINNSHSKILNKLINYKNKNDKLPYKTFKIDYPEKIYPTKGEYSTSYFIKIGTCPTSINNRQQCIKKGYKWISNPKKLTNIQKYFSKIGPQKIFAINQPDNECIKPQYMYINNRPQGKEKGIVPSIAEDIMNITPEKLSAILNGHNTLSGGVIPCKKQDNIYKSREFNPNEYKKYEAKLNNKIKIINSNKYKPRVKNLLVKPYKNLFKTETIYEHFSNNKVILFFSLIIILLLLIIKK